MPIALAMEIFDGCGGFSRYHQCFARCSRIFTSMASRPKAACFSRSVEGNTVQPAFINVGVHFSSLRRSLSVCSDLLTVMSFTICPVLKEFQVVLMGLNASGRE